MPPSTRRLRQQPQAQQVQQATFSDDPLSESEIMEAQDALSEEEDDGEGQELMDGIEADEDGQLGEWIFDLSDFWPVIFFLTPSFAYCHDVSRRVSFGTTRSVLPIASLIRRTITRNPHGEDLHREIPLWLWSRWSFSFVLDYSQTCLSIMLRTDTSVTRRMHSEKESEWPLMFPPDLRFAYVLLCVMLHDACKLLLFTFHFCPFSLFSLFSTSFFLPFSFSLHIASLWIATISNCYYSHISLFSHTLLLLDALLPLNHIVLHISSYGSHFSISINLHYLAHRPRFSYRFFFVHVTVMDVFLFLHDLCFRLCMWFPIGPKVRLLVGNPWIRPFLHGPEGNRSHRRALPMNMVLLYCWRLTN